MDIKGFLPAVKKKKPKNESSEKKESVSLNANALFSIFHIDL